MVKLNLILDANNFLTGYRNVYQFESVVNVSNELVAGDVADLNNIVDDAEADEILAHDVLDYIPSPALETTVANWISKLRHGGTISVSGVDIILVSKALVQQRITLTDANFLLYGEQNEPWEYRKATLTMNTIVSIFQENGLKLLSKTYDGYKYYVKAERL